MIAVEAAASRRGVYCAPICKSDRRDKMKLEKLPHELTVCKVESLGDVDLAGDVFFIGKTSDELSLVCETCAVPERAVAREDGWRAFRIVGTLDFSLVGILAEIAAVLAQSGIGIFAVSTYDTDYILVKAENFDVAADALLAAGHGIV